MPSSHRLLCALVLLAAPGCGSTPPVAARPYFVDESWTQPFRLPAAPTQRRPSYAGAATVLFLQLDGAQISNGPSDSVNNQSYLCSASFPAWDHSPFGANRAETIGRLRLALLDLFADFNLQVASERPAAPPYDMVVVGGTASLCGRPDGLGGLGPLDCGNVDLSDVAFVFSATILSLEGLAVSIAHEAGHTWGLPHTLDPCDVMSSFWCSGGKKRFLDREMVVPPEPSGNCGLQSSNSWQRLREILGPRPASPDLPRPADAGKNDSRAAGRPEAGPSPAPAPSGCGLARDTCSRRAASLLIFLPLVLLLYRRSPGLSGGKASLRRAARTAEMAHGDSRRDQLGHR